MIECSVTSALLVRHWLLWNYKREALTHLRGALVSLDADKRGEINFFKRSACAKAQ